MDIFACLLGQAAEEGGGKEGGLRVKIPQGVFVFEDDVTPDKPHDSTVLVAVPGDAQDTDAHRGSAEDECHGANMRQIWWQADAWAETTIDLPTFILTFIYEVTPMGVSGLLCWLFEGKASAQNRMLVPSFSFGRGHARMVLWQSTFTTFTWALLVLWLATQPDEVPGIDIAFPFILVAWRSACISMKYAYFSPSDLERVRRSFHFTNTRHAERLLGVHKFFNAAGTLLYDHMEELFKAALRTGMLEEARTGFLTMKPDVAKQIWHQLREDLEPERMSRQMGEKVPRAGRWQSKYGDVQEMLGLASLEAVDEMVGQGRLPVVVAAYYFIHRAWRGRGMATAATLLILGASLSVLHPLVLHCSGRAGFGTSAAGRAVYVLRVVGVCQLLRPTFIYLAFPVMDSSARFLMSVSLISSFGRGEARAKRLCRGFVDPSFPIESMSDLRAFWCLGRLLGTAYEAGMLVRYSSAFVTVHVFFLCVATASLLGASMRGEMSWGVSAELTALFVVGSAAVVVASLFCVGINWQVPMYVSLARQAALQHPELGGVAKDVAADFKTEHLVINPVQMMYIPATPALLSVLWSGMVVLSGVFFASLPSVCVPLFFSRGCSKA